VVSKYRRFRDHRDRGHVELSEAPFTVIELLDVGQSKSRPPVPPLTHFGATSPSEGVPTELLGPRGTWDNTAAYDAWAKKLAGMFEENSEQYSAGVDQAVVDSGPKG
jgi:hypothetical protein